MATPDHSLTLHVVVCVCTEAELVDRLMGIISDHLTANRHPDGVAPAALAEDIITRLRGGLGVLWTGEDFD